MKLRLLNLALALGLTAFSLKVPTLAQEMPTEPYVIRHSLIARASFSPLYEPPGAKEPKTNFTNWLPHVQFQLRGPLPAGSQVFADFAKPDGKPWMTLKMGVYDGSIPELGPDEAANFESERHTQQQEKLGQIQGGVYPFKIRAKTPAGDKILFSGRMKIQKVHRGGAGGETFKNYFIFYNDYDWVAPMGYLTQDTVYDPDKPAVQILAWLKGPKQDGTRISGNLFYKGAQISGTATENEHGYAQGTAGDTLRVFPYEDVVGQEETQHWKLWRFTFSNVYGYLKDGDLPSGYHVLAANPGEYEFKLMRDGVVVRSAKFTVKSDGWVDPTGLVEPSYDIESGLHKRSTDKMTYWMLLPMTVQGNKDGAVDMKAWQTEAFFGNPPWKK